MPIFWGTPKTSKDYHLYVEGNTPISLPQSLFGHTVTSPSPNNADAVTRRYTELLNGVAVDREEVLRAAQQLSLTLTMGFSSYAESYLKERIKQSPLCKLTLYNVELCPNPREKRAYIWQDCIFNPPARVNDVNTVEDTALQDWQSEFRIVFEQELKAVGAFVQKIALETPVPLYDVSFFTAQCVRCSTGGYQAQAIAVGGNGTDAIVVLLTTSRFGSSAAPGGTVPAPTGSIGTSVWTKGNIVLVGFSDEPKTAYGTGTAPAAGGVMFSNDAGENFSLDTNISVPIMDVTFFNNKYYAVGGADGGAAYIASSEDGVTWTSITTPDDVSDDPFTSISVDEVNGKIYLTTQAGLFYSGEEVGGSITFSELTLPGSPTALWSCAVLGSDRVAVAGKTASSNYYAETFDGGAEFVSPTVSGTAQILAVGGNRHHQLVANASIVRTRSILTDFQYQTVELQNGAAITGNYTSVCFAPDGYLTHSLLTTDDGEIISVRDFSPFYQ